MKVGDKVRTIGFHEGIEGIVTSLREGVDNENHGTIEIQIEKITKPEIYNWLEVGDLEHFVHFGWQKDLEIVE